MRTSIAVLLLLVLTSFSYAYVYAKVKVLGGGVIEARKNILLLNNKKENLARAERNIKEYEAEIKKVQDSFVSEENFVDFVKQLEAIARTARVQFRARDARLPMRASERASISFTVEGNFVSLARFFILLDAISEHGIVSAATIREGDEERSPSADVEFIILNFVL